MSVALWYYVENGTSIGPVEGTEIERLIGLTTITSDTLVWQVGMQDWMVASQHFSFAGTPPPLNQRGFVQDGLLGETRIPTAINGGAPPRAFCEAISVCFLKYVGFSGRASRSEFWYWVLFSILAGIVTGLIDLVFFGVDNDFSPINSLFSLATFMPSLAVAFRRLHDTGRSGWWLFPRDYCWCDFGWVRGCRQSKW